MKLMPCLMALIGTGLSLPSSASTNHNLTHTCNDGAAAVGAELTSGRGWSYNYRTLMIRDEGVLDYLYRAGIMSLDVIDHGTWTLKLDVGEDRVMRTHSGQVYETTLAHVGLKARGEAVWDHDGLTVRFFDLGHGGEIVNWHFEHCEVLP